MTNEPLKLGSVSLEARHVPEPHDPEGPNPHDAGHPVTGFVDIGAVVDGVFVTLVRRKASGVFADIERAKQSKAKPAKTSE